VILGNFGPLYQGVQIFDRVNSPQRHVHIPLGILV